MPILAEFRAGTVTEVDCREAHKELVECLNDVLDNTDVSSCTPLMQFMAGLLTGDEHTYEDKHCTGK